MENSWACGSGPDGPAYAREERTGKSDATAKIESVSSHHASEFRLPQKEKYRRRHPQLNVCSKALAVVSAVPPPRER